MPLEHLTRFKLTLGKCTISEGNFVRANIAKFPCVFAIVIESENQLFGFVRTTTGHSITWIRTNLFRAYQIVKIEAVGQSVSDTEVVMEYGVMISDKRSITMCIGSPVPSTASRVEKVQIRDDPTFFRSLWPKPYKVTDAGVQRNLENKTKRRAVDSAASRVKKVRIRDDPTYVRSLCPKPYEVTDAGVQRSPENKTRLVHFKKIILAHYLQQQAVRTPKNSDVVSGKKKN